eukprot:COSAG05_NODE_513_length_9084_cov_5.373957_14_plen_56_part_00
MDPYLRQLYSVSLDASCTDDSAKSALLTPENADHRVFFSPDGSKRPLSDLRCARK